VKRVLALILFCAFHAGAATVFVSQSGGSVSCGADGTQSTTAVASITWTAGNTYKLCGAITSQISVTASGSAGNLISIIGESNASLISPTGFSGGGIELNGNSFILIDGGTPCGRTNGSQTTCSSTLTGTMTISNTNNGSPGSETNHVLTTFGIEGGAGGSNACGHDIEIRNLIITNIYIHPAGVVDDTVDASNPFNAGIYFACPSPNGANIKIHDLTSTQSHTNIGFSGQSTMTNLQVYNNVVTQGVWGIEAGIENTSSGLATNWIIYSNDVNMTANWSQTDGVYHVDGIFVFGQSSGNAVNGLYVYNNYLHGDWAVTGQCPTGFTNLNQNLQNVYLFNNQYLLTGHFGCNGTMTTGFANVSNFIFNNTLIGYSSSSGTTEGAIGDDNASGSNATTIENNVVSTYQAAISYGDSVAADIALIDHNDYFNVSGNGICNPWIVGTTCPATFTAWKACSACTAGGAPDTNGSNSNPNLAGSFPFTLGSGSAAIGLGANLTSTCSGQPNPGLGALCSDAQGNARPTSGAWDAGAINFAAGTIVATPVLSPTSGAVPQTVTITDSTPSAVICYTTNGATPTAATAGTCDQNTYSGPLSITVASTVRTIGTLVGATNSSIASATFTAGTGATNGTLSGGVKISGGAKIQ
jgi:hypothetical protein